ncbi:MAG: RNA 3'-terminal phosphate cyclase [Candidatus Aenigmarchaeota archaeon]|nr:RNA 3'-terminal phosphate cyclase [Candidatus Aenigmarchaeota archaeon]
MIEIDGSYLEGGGQILRTSVALSALTKTPVRIYNIRANRPQAGLKAQHLSAIKAVSMLYNGKLTGDELGSTEITFSPGEMKENHLKISIGTAGSIGLLLQAIILSSVNTEKELIVEVEGGATFGKWAPSVPYLQNVFLPTIRKFGFRGEIEIIKHGFYPRGGAKAIARISPSKMKGHIFAHEIKSVSGLSVATENLRGAKVAERQKAGAEELLKGLKTPIEIKTRYVYSPSTGTGIDLWSEPTLLGGNALGEVGKKAEDIGKAAAKTLKELIESKATVDRNLADQILPFMALAEGHSSFLVKDLSNHAKTNIWVIEQFLDRKFKVAEKDGLVEVGI